MDGKDFNKLTTEYTEKYLKDSETFKDHLEDLEKSLMEDKRGSEPMPQWQNLALFSANSVVQITDQDQIKLLALIGDKDKNLASLQNKVREIEELLTKEKGISSELKKEKADLYDENEKSLKIKNELHNKHHKDFGLQSMLYYLLHNFHIEHHIHYNVLHLFFAF